MIERSATLGALFAETARAWPDRIAVIDEHGATDYRTLNALAAAWAAALIGNWGIRPADRAVLCLPRNAHLIVAVHALARLGCTLVPVSHDLPATRLRYIVEDAEATVVLVANAGRTSPERIGGAQVVDIDQLPRQVTPAPGSVTATAAAPAYLMYTSGTTGDPKGVATSHDAILRRYQDWERVFGFERRATRILQAAKPGFDVFIGDVVKAFGSGGTLVVCPDMAILQPDALAHWLIEHRIDYFDTVPAVLRSLVEHFEAAGGDLSGLAIINCGADFWTKREYLRARAVLKIGRLFNGYGVTECTVESTLFEDDGTLLAERETLPIGRPLASDHILIVDDALRPVPPGTIGQLCLGGPCVALGYVKRPEREARAFVKLPHAPEAGRVYLTGDLARVAPDGLIELTGRNDSQIKIRGQRIEIHEIERVLERHPEVRQAVVHYEASRATLYAFVLMAEGSHFDRAALAAFAAGYLPAYMRPAQIIAVDRIPLNANNKVDRQALFVTSRQEPARARAPSFDTLTSCDHPEALQATLASYGLDLCTLVAEFVKPAARRAILVQRPSASAAAGCASLTLLILLESMDSLKKARTDIYGSSIKALPCATAEERAIAFVVGGLQIQCSFRVRPAPVPATGPLLETWVLHDDGLLSGALTTQASSTLVC